MAFCIYKTWGQVNSGNSKLDIYMDVCNDVVQVMSIAKAVAIETISATRVASPIA